MADKALIAARWQLGMLAPSELHATAGQLLDDGEMTPALLDLFAAEDAWPAEATRLFERALAELGLEPITDEQAVDVVWRGLARSIVDGSMEARTGCGLGAGLWHMVDYRASPLAELYALDELYAELECYGVTYRGDTEATLAEEVRAVAGRLLVPTRRRRFSLRRPTGRGA